MLALAPVVGDVAAVAADQVIAVGAVDIGAARIAPSVDGESAGSAKHRRWLCR